MKSGERIRAGNRPFFNPSAGEGTMAEKAILQGRTVSAAAAGDVSRAAAKETEPAGNGGLSHSAELSAALQVEKTSGRSYKYENSEKSENGDFSETLRGEDAERGNTAEKTAEKAEEQGGESDFSSPPTPLPRHGFLRGAFIISLGSFFSKVIGAAARIPLTGLLGAEGVGLYQLAYPFYCLLLTVSSAGLPSGISRIVAREESCGRDGRAVFRSAFSLFFLVGMVGSLLMFALRGVISDLQGEDLRWCYVALCPSVLLVSLLSVFRGYFQGRCNMAPTAVSEITEQVVKGVFSIAFAWFFRDNVLYAVTAVLAAVSLSEGWAVLYMFRRYRAEKSLYPPRAGIKPTYRKLLSMTLPVALAAAILPLSQFVDSWLGVRLMRAYTGEAVALYGLYAGGAVTLVGLPVSVCYGFAVSIIPRLSAKAGARGKVLKALGFTLLVSLPCALVLFFFARPLGGLFFQRLSGERLDILETLIKILAPTAVTHACAQTLSACLVGRGRAMRAAGNMAIAVSLKIALVFFLVRMQNISVGGMAFAANGCYLTAFVLNLISSLQREREKNAEKKG